MEDMPARNARLGSVRPPASSLVVQVRGHGLLFALALTGIAVALLSQLDTVEANACVKTLPWRGVEVEPEVVQQRQVKKTAMSHLFPRGGPVDYELRNRSVKCEYFTEWPPHTYCHIRNAAHVSTMMHAYDLCNSIDMGSVLSMTSTPMYRICRLIRLFGIEDRRLWVVDTLHQPDTLSWEDCYFRGENETKPAVNCGSCNVTVICQDEFILSNGPRCATVSEGDNYAEYCFENDEVVAEDASKGCAQRSSTLIDTQEVHRRVPYLLYSLVNFAQESWVDLKKEDVSELSGVVSVNFAEIDWTSSCTTVWIGGGVPRFYVRNCSDLYPVLCESSNASIYGDSNDIPDCGTSDSMYCFSGTHKFNKTTGSEFCAKYTLSLLSGKALRTLTFARRNYSTSSGTRLVVWDAQSILGNSKSCAAYLAWGQETLRLFGIDCFTNFQYFCKKSKPRLTHGFDCEDASMSLWALRPVCVSNVEKDFPESVKACAKLGMDLLPSGLQKEEYTDIVQNYFRMYMVPRPQYSLWVDIPESMNQSGCSVRSDRYASISESTPAQFCTESIGSTLCLFSNKEIPATVDDTTVETAGRRHITAVDGASSVP